MKIAVLGGDGFCGWPTALHLSKKGNEVLIIDNLSRRSYDIELGCDSLNPISSIHKRIETWNKLTNHKIEFLNIDLSKDFNPIKNIIEEKHLDTVIHFAEQRAAPYSMKSLNHEKFTVHNNISNTHNILLAISKLKRKPHLIHLGTMGVYGYDGDSFTIPEGYLKIKLKNDENEWIDREVLYPPNPGSVYHMTKCMDALLFQFYNKNYNIKITDLHQGIVWGHETLETKLHTNLNNRFDYDGDFGTVLNRFLIQSAINYPLTVHGTGEQTRAFININDTIKCISLAVENEPSERRVRIMNQMSETHKLIDLAKTVSSITGSKIAFVDNPRNELAANSLKVENKSFHNLGWEPIKINKKRLLEIISFVKKMKGNINKDLIPAKSIWNDSKSPGIPKGI